MRIPATLVALGLMTAAAAAHAELSSAWTMTNDYDYRGISQTAKDSALQASLDFSTDLSTNMGGYAGAWASNVDFGPGSDADYELDVYTGFSGGAEDGLGWDVGLLYYSYPGASDTNFLEVYGGLAYGWFDSKLSYSNDFGGDATAGDTSATYLQANASFPLPAEFSLLLHAGLSSGDYWDEINGDDQLDYSIGVGYTLGTFDVALKYVDAKSDVEVTQGVFNNEGRLIFSVATIFPWKGSE